MHKVCDRLINTPRNFPAHSAANSPICGLMSFPDRQTVLDFLKENPAATSKADIARGLKVKGKERAILREVLEELEREGKLERTGKRSFAQTDRPPPSSLVEFTRLTREGDLAGQCVGDHGLSGPELIYGGPSGKSRSRAPAKGDRAVCKISGREDGSWRAYVVTLLEKRVSERIVGLYNKTLEFESKKLKVLTLD